MSALYQKSDCGGNPLHVTCCEEDKFVISRRYRAALARAAGKRTAAIYKEGRVTAVPPPTEGGTRTVAVHFNHNEEEVTINLPLDDVELVIEQSLLFQTAVFWALQEPREKLVEPAINFLLDSGFLMRDGLNVARLHYDRDDRWWKWGEKISDPTGALVVTSAPAWDGTTFGCDIDHSNDNGSRGDGISKCGKALLGHTQVRPYAGHAWCGESFLSAVQ